MKSLRNLFLVAGFAAITLLSTFAAAEPSSSGAFTLPQEARWGSVVLPAGRYIYAVEYRGAGTVVTIKTGAGRPVAMILPQTYSQVPYSGPDQVTMRTQGSETYITSLRVASLGMLLEYATPEPAKTVVASTSAALATGGSK
ncbi:MAG: hypothetical protein JST79_14310 [Acidobacteria bacterium]|nr:hypothetical protein [Acidobacteriota bacterium]